MKFDWRTRNVEFKLPDNYFPRPMVDTANDVLFDILDILHRYDDDVVKIVVAALAHVTDTNIRFVEESRREISGTASRQ